MAGGRLAFLITAALLSLSPAQAASSSGKVFEITLEDGPGAQNIRTLYVTFYRKSPPPSVVDNMVRNALEEAIAIDSSKDIVATAFLGEAALSNNQYSGGLVFDAHQNKIMTFDEYRGLKTTTSENSDYFVEVTEEKTFEGITPERKWLDVTLVFASKPTQDFAYKAIEEEAQKLLARGLDMNLYVSIGDKKVRTSWIQMEDTDGTYVAADYDTASKTLAHQDEVLKQF
jgi:hypothetical protein